MDAEEIKQKSVELIKKLSEKIDKCEWRKIVMRDFKGSTQDFILEFKDSGSVVISRDTISVYTKDSTLVSEYQPTAENGNAYALAVLWGNVCGKIQKPINAKLGLIITELDKL